MTNHCTGGYYGKDWQVYTSEDQRACIESGGSVVSSDSSGCGSTTLSAMAAGPDNPNRGFIAEMALDPLRQARARFGAHELVRAVLKINQDTASEIEAITAENVELRNKLVKAFITLTGLAKAITADAPPTGTLTKEGFAVIEGAGRHLLGELKASESKKDIERALELASSFVGMSLADVAAKLKDGAGDGSAEKETKELLLPSGSVISTIMQKKGVLTLSQAVREHGLSIGAFVDLVEADRAIQAKAKALGWVGSGMGGIEVVAGGHRRRFENADIYVGASGTAFEVHGDIRAKYNWLGGPMSQLGLPATDETTTPDAIGRFNHFEKNGSIYWTPNTGPFMVIGRIRQEWASQGWETGAMGYPVHDQQAMPGLNPTDNPNISWCLFQNGSILSIAGAAAIALFAEIRPDQMRTMIRSFFDQRLKAANSDLGLEAPVELSVGDWSYGFWAAESRLLTFSMHGFHDNGIWPDTTFDLHVRLRFSTTWPNSFSYPTSLTLIASLDWVKVHSSGLGSGELANKLKDGVVGAFYRGGPDPEHAEVPDGAVFITSIPTGASQSGSGSLDVIDVLTTAQGGLKILLNPLPPDIAKFREMIAQQRVDAFLGL